MKRRDGSRTIRGALVIVGGLCLAASNLCAGVWTVEEIRVLKGFDIPECALPVPGSDHLFVSNVVTPNEQYWIDDGNGFISLLSKEGAVVNEQWLVHSAKSPLHDPKGMCFLDGYLYFNDNKRLKRVEVDSDSRTPEVVELPGGENLNDLATDGKAVWATDTAAGKAYRVETDGAVTEIPAPESINGITCHKGRVFAVSWDLHEAYELDPEGKKPPRAFGLAEHFTNLDGIEVLDDGAFVVSDSTGNKVGLISPDENTVTTLVELNNPADIGIDRETNLLYIPLLLKDRVAVYKLSKN